MQPQVAAGMEFSGKRKRSDAVEFCNYLKGNSTAMAFTSDVGSLAMALLKARKDQQHQRRQL